jgi:hypothetical protein
MKTDRCVALLQGKSKKVKGKICRGFAFAPPFPNTHINLHLQMQNPLRLHRSLVPAFSDIGQSIPKSREPENLEIIAGMLCPYACLLIPTLEIKI